MVKKYLEDINDLSRLAKKIVLSHPRGYVGAIVEGFRGRGKSVFCLNTGRQVFQYHYGITRDDAWEMTLRNIVFAIDEVDKMFDVIDKIDFNDASKMSEWFNEETHVFKIWDDAGMHGGKYKYIVAQKQVEHLQGNLDVMRFILTGFLINSPELAHLLKFLREYHDHIIVEIKGRKEGGSDYERRAVFKTWQKDKLGRWHLKKNPPHTPFSCFLGDVDRLGLKEQWVYDEFELMKASAIKRNRDEFRQMVKVAKKHEPDKKPWDVLGISKETYEDMEKM
jgi:hypothetical protein